MQPETTQRVSVRLSVTDVEHFMEEYKPGFSPLTPPLRGSPQEVAGGVEHAGEGGQPVGPLAPLVHPEEQRLAERLQLRQLLPQLLGGGGVALLVHPLRRRAQLGHDLLLLLVGHGLLVLLLVQLVLFGTRDGERERERRTERETERQRQRQRQRETQRDTETERER